MLIYKKGNIVDAILNKDIDIAVQGCNCFCGFGGGLALEVNECIPEAVLADQKTVSGDKSKLGTYSKAVLSNGKTFLNLYTQYHYIKGLNNEPKIKKGKYKYLLCDYEAVRSCCKKIREDFSSDSVIAFPKIGCGFANGDWQIVESIIKEELKDFKIIIYHI